MIDYDEGEWFYSSLFRIHGSVIPRALLFSVPAAFLTWLLAVAGEESRRIWLDTIFGQGFQEVSESASQIYSATTAALMLLLGFRTKEAMSRFWEGTSLLHQMRGEWFDTVGCLVTFSRDHIDDIPKKVSEFRHTLIRLMSLCHGSALEELKDEESDNFEVLDIAGLDRNTLEYLDDCKKVYDFNRVEVLLHQIQVLILHNIKEGVLTIAPPILSRVFQTLSRGHVNLLNATKIQNTLFPYPFAQLISVLMLVHTLWTPFMIASIVKLPWLAVLTSFLPLFGAYSLNFVAIQLEKPFGNDHNDLPLIAFQQEMNKGLMMLLHPKSDLLPATGSTCEMDWEVLSRNENTRLQPGRKPTPHLKKQSSMFEDAVARSSTEVRSPLRRPTLPFRASRSSISVSSDKSRKKNADLIEAALHSSHDEAELSRDMAVGAEGVPQALEPEPPDGAAGPGQAWLGYSRSTSAVEGPPSSLADASDWPGHFRGMASGSSLTLDPALESTDQEEEDFNFSERKEDAPRAASRSPRCPSAVQLQHPVAPLQPDAQHDWGGQGGSAWRRRSQDGGVAAAVVAEVHAT